ncbi:MAG TPA: hypothetical protein DIU00_01780 [Phycisphaerales bacterium]|nr:hypothetical protein [Phycisphaerales bacterium]
MKRDIFSYRIFPFVTLCAWLLLSGAVSFGFPAGSNGWHLNSSFQARANADLVCKVQVMSIRQEKIVKGNLFPGQQDLLGMIATSKVLSIIKGECPDVIDIEFRHPKNGNSMLGLLPGELYTDLSENEVCLVFLKASGDNYKLGRIKSKARVRPEVAQYNLGETPDLKLLAEFLAGRDSENELVKLQAAEELGYLGDAMIRKIRFSREDKELFRIMAAGLMRAKEALRKMRSCDDMVVRNVSIISSFQADDSPGFEGPLKLLRMNPSDFDLNDSLGKYGIRDFCVSSLQLRLLETMDDSTRRVVIDLKDGSVIRREKGSPYPYRGVRDFDYADFYRQALDCEAVKNNEQMRTAIANVLWRRYEMASVPEMIGFLDNSKIYIRMAAVSALRRCINSDHSNSWEPRHFYDPDAAREYMYRGIEKKLEDRQKDYQDNEQEYILYWKKWWRQHKNEFEKS